MLKIITLHYAEVESKYIGKGQKKFISGEKTLIVCSSANFAYNTFNIISVALRDHFKIIINFIVSVNFAVVPVKCKSVTTSMQEIMFSLLSRKS